ncbi:MAG: acylneuraminate cytidylyltransferase family protein [Flavobacteriaceae bacterium]|jgi:CMP-N,N'-diacetyllegionaminic acid synthase|nr:acylneuraminate cytidylyltransferase family protein [Flavobacteriaceae bacterium]MBT6170241.1 acylneuraminate cytidylyltransferase family protein [Flavobacteriaceae bacterium]
MEVLITICARGGSIGIPKKNIKPLNNTPLINYTINLAKKVANRWNAKIALSTDNEEILNTARLSNINTSYLRPKSLSNNKSGKVETLDHLVDYEEKKLSKTYDFILDLDVSSPLRNLDDIINGFNIISKDKNMLNLFSVSNPNRNPYFNVVEENKLTGYYNLVKKLNKPVQSRQMAPKVFDMNSSFYWYRRSFFNSGNNSPITDRTGIYIMNHICFDLDHNIDFTFMEFLIKNNLLDFTL